MGIFSAFLQPNINEPARKTGRYESCEITLSKKDIKSVKVQTGQEGSMYGSLDFVKRGFGRKLDGGSIKGDMKTVPYYYVLVDYHEKGYLLEKYPAEKLYIKETPEEPYIENRARCIVLDEEDVISSDKQHIYVDNIRYDRGGLNDFYNIDDAFRDRYKSVDDWGLPSRILDEIKRQGLNIDNTFINRITTTLYIPECSVVEEFVLM